jgi:hypothetical protein
MTQGAPRVYLGPVPEQALISAGLWRVSALVLIQNTSDLYF